MAQSQARGVRPAAGGGVIAFAQCPCVCWLGYADGRPGDDTTALVTRADRSMYHRKDAGRSAPLGRRTAPSRAESSPDDGLRGMVGDAVERGRLRLQFQPVVDLVSATLVGAEALLRLRDDAGRMIAPDRFIPVAEATGMITGLGRRVRDRALQQAAVWTADLPAARDFGIGVNLSPLQLYDPDLVGCLAAALDASGLEPSAVVLELTESQLVPSTAPVHEVLTGLLDLGAHLALDDFGTGYGGISYLADFPFDLIKVDRRFTSRFTVGGPAARLARGVLALARETGIVTVSEGVETVEQQRAVLVAGCRLGQGYRRRAPPSGSMVRASASLAACALAGLTYSTEAMRLPSGRPHRVVAVFRPVAVAGQVADAVDALAHRRAGSRDGHDVLDLAGRWSAVAVGLEDDEVLRGPGVACERS